MYTTDRVSGDTDKHAILSQYFMLCGNSGRLQYCLQHTDSCESLKRLVTNEPQCYIS